MRQNELGVRHVPNDGVREPMPDVAVFTVGRPVIGTNDDDRRRTLRERIEQAAELAIDISERRRLRRARIGRVAR